jgi:threonine/homoserine efflux transporter RhtA
VAVIYSADPAIAAVIGVIALSETLTTLQIPASPRSSRRAPA